jgi:hypothetical protein
MNVGGTTDPLKNEKNIDTKEHGIIVMSTLVVGLLLSVTIMAPIVRDDIFPHVKIDPDIDPDPDLHDTDHKRDEEEIVITTINIIHTINTIDIISAFHCGSTEEKKNREGVTREIIGVENPSPHQLLVTAPNHRTDPPPSIPRTRLNTIPILHSMTNTVITLLHLEKILPPDGKS